MSVRNLSNPSLWCCEKNQIDFRTALFLDNKKSSNNFNWNDIVDDSKIPNSNKDGIFCEICGKSSQIQCIRDLKQYFVYIRSELAICIQCKIDCVDHAEKKTNFNGFM